MDARSESSTRSKASLPDRKSRPFLQGPDASRLGKRVNVFARYQRPLGRYSSEMRVLVTGGAGFIGSNLVRGLVDQGHSVAVLDDLSTGRLENLAGVELDFRPGSILDPSAARESAEGVSAIVHLAARGSVPRSVSDPLATNEVNCSGTLQVLQTARETGAHVIFSSSSSVYGENVLLPKREETWTQPISPYGASKLAAESYAMAYRAVYGLDVLVLRFFNVYGPRQRADHDYAAVIPRFAWNALSGLPIQVHGDGEQTRDFTHVDSVVDILSEAVQRRVSWDRPVNLAFGERISVNRVVDEVKHAVGRAVVVDHAETRAADVRDSQNDPRLLMELFPNSHPVPFATGVGSVVEWLRGER